mmetsp:Transcript_27601/g.93942  ORF Transcript_27601/g.93942 Transcript_27601/m.93942 type:complete len:103 (-) Transcript_27601:22-330(-)
MARARARMLGGELMKNGDPLTVHEQPPEFDEPPPPGSEPPPLPPRPPPEPVISKEESIALAVDAAKATLEKVDALLGELYDVPDFAAFAKSRAEAKKAKKKA